MSAGIYALQAGYSVEIYEKNKMPGGECAGWNRQGYHIDNCIHFLVGCNKDEQLYKMWENLGVLSDSLEIYREPYFYCMENGRGNTTFVEKFRESKKRVFRTCSRRYQRIKFVF